MLSGASEIVEVNSESGSESNGSIPVRGSLSQVGEVGRFFGHFLALVFVPKLQ